MGLLDNLLDAVTTTEGRQSLINGAAFVMENVNSEKRVIKKSKAQYRLKIKKKRIIKSTLKSMMNMITQSIELDGCFLILGAHESNYTILITTKLDM